MMCLLSRQVPHRGELSSFFGRLALHPHGQSLGQFIGIRPSGRNVPPLHFPPHGASGAGGVGGAGGVTWGDNAA
jgi:hypothetical protein